MSADQGNMGSQTLYPKTSNPHYPRPKWFRVIRYGFYKIDGFFLLIGLPLIIGIVCLLFLIFFVNPVSLINLSFCLAIGFAFTPLFFFLKRLAKKDEEQEKAVERTREYEKYREQKSSILAAQFATIDALEDDPRYPRPLWLRGLRKLCSSLLTPWSALYTLICIAAGCIYFFTHFSLPLTPNSLFLFKSSDIEVLLIIIIPPMPLFMYIDYIVQKDKEKEEIITRNRTYKKDALQAQRGFDTQLILYPTWDQLRFPLIWHKTLALLTFKNILFACIINLIISITAILTTQIFQNEYYGYIVVIIVVILVIIFISLLFLYPIAYKEVRFMQRYNSVMLKQRLYREE